MAGLSLAVTLTASWTPFPVPSKVRVELAAGLALGRSEARGLLRRLRRVK